MVRLPMKDELVKQVQKILGTSYQPDKIKKSLSDNSNDIALTVAALKQAKGSECILLYSL
jgi:hypothetical protein